MAVDKLVDSTQLNSDLTSIANAIRTKGGTSAQLAFPSDFVTAIGALPSGGAPTLGTYKMVTGQITPESAGSIDFNLTITETVDAVKFGVIWLDDNSVISNYSTENMMLISDSPEYAGYSTITHINSGTQTAELKTAYGLFVTKTNAHTIRFWYKSHANWPAQPETYNYVVVYSVTG